MYYLRARYYDQASGRFLGMDPYAGQLQEPMTLHRYLYAGPNPVLNWDPSGRSYLGIQMAVIQLTQRIGVMYSTAAAGRYTWMYAQRMVSGWNWQVEILRSIQSRYANTWVSFEKYFVTGSMARMDIVLKHGQTGTQRLLIETKGWNFDYIAKFPQRADSMLLQLEQQAIRYSGSSEKIIYAIKDSATTQRGRDLLTKAVNIINDNGHRAAVGTQKVMNEIQKFYE